MATQTRMDNKVKAGFFILGAALVIVTAMLLYGIATNNNQLNEVKQSAQSAKVAAEKAKRSAKLVAISARNSHRALCSIKSGYMVDLHSSQKYLKEHPNGAPGLGFTAAQVKAQVEQSISRIEVQLHGLKDIKCS